MKRKVEAGNFTGFARHYSEYPPDYCRSILKSVAGLLKKSPSDIDFVDIGVGTRV